jgi:RNA-directed DNA polymerase
LGNLSTPKSVQKLQTALRAKAKVEADYRFYALYDKISREDVLTHAYAQCRSTRAHRAWMVKDSRTLKRMGCNDGSANWRFALRQETYPRPCVIGSA